ncbi:hypothetical protein EDC65_3045 [Stella humosa]|uniref:Glycosyl transferase family 2 n=1 Tax=Stella humosa TaxID=94 RepID=A0A3N1LIK3_9PROT|nr:hypothetical protein [Stella humosa]ROP91182.1 hypothetical protein EDC65_3045 [Stella humosa]BBK34466.1 hypothetical protein STHU_51000 [Stella humosa]
MFHRLTENVVVQEARPPAGAVAVSWDDRAAPAARTDRIAHAVQFYRADGLAERTQARTAESMRRAAATAMGVRLVAVTMAGEPDAVPAGFVSSPPLERVVTDLRPFAVPRPLPLLFDILRSASAAGWPDGYLVFTNSDICLQEHFYRGVRALLDAGADCLVINRRTVGDLAGYGGRDDLAALEAGAEHEGFDCFVFPTSWLADFAANDCCVGIALIGRSLLYNMVARAERMVILRGAALTYHYGDDRQWQDDRFRDYNRHNLIALGQSMSRLLADSHHRRRLEAFLGAYPEPQGIAWWDARLRDDARRAVASRA